MDRRVPWFRAQRFRVQWIAVIAILVAATGVSAQTYTTVTVSGTVTWDGVGPVCGYPLIWGIGRVGVPLPVFVSTLYTNSQGGFYGSTMIYGYSSGTYVMGGRQLPGFPQNIVVGAFFPPMGGTTTLHVPVPVALVSGAFQPPNTWDGLLSSFSPTRVVTLPNAEVSDHLANAQSLATVMDQYRKDVLQACALSARPIQFDLVAHSLDGLVARAYIANHTGGSGQDTVRKCITLGTPHVGTCWLETAPASWPPFQVSPTLVQSRPSWLINVFPTHLTRGYGATRFFLAGSSVDMNTSEPEAIPNWPFDKNDDGLVSAFSATYPFAGTNYPPEETAFFPEAHYDLPKAPNVIQQVVTWLRKP